MLPLSDGLPARRFPVVNVALIAANIAVWVFYELPDLGGAVAQASFYPCDVDNTCERRCRGQSAGSRRCSCTGAGTTCSATCSSSRSSARTSRTRSAISATWASTWPAGSPRPRLQTSMTLSVRGPTADAQVPMLGASGAISAVLGAFLVLYPHARIKTLVLVFFVQIPAWAYLGGWFLYQLHSAHESLFVASADGAASRSSRTSAGSCSVGSSRGRCAMRDGSTLRPVLRRRPALLPH